MLPPTQEQFWSKDDPSKPDIAFLKNHFYREGRLTEDQALFIIERATDVLRQEPNLLEIDAPITGTCSVWPCPEARQLLGRVVVVTKMMQALVLMLVPSPSPQSAVISTVNT